MNLRELLMLKAAGAGGSPSVEQTATGNPVLFTTNRTKPLKELTAGISFSQAGSGDPYFGGDGKNLFNKNDVYIVNGYIADSAFSTANSNGRTVYIPISPSTTYSVRKTSGSRFTIATSSAIPSNGQTFTEKTSRDTGTTLTITSGANDAYIWVFCYLNGTDSKSLSAILDSLQIEVGPSSTAYAPYENIRTIYGANYLLARQYGKNIAHVYGYSASNVAAHTSNSSLSNSYGTTINTTSPDDGKVVVTQSTYTTDYTIGSYRNGYISIRVDTLMAGWSYDVSFKVTDIVSNPLNASLSDIYIICSGNNQSTNPTVKGDTLIFKNFLYTQDGTRDHVEIRVCGMSCTISEFMITPANTSDGVYEPFSIYQYYVEFPALGNNLFNYQNADFITGYYNGDGVYQSAPESSVNNNFISINPNQKYRLKYNGADNYIRSLYYYDENKLFISRYAPGYTNNTTFTTPSNAHYLKFQINSSADTSKFMLSAGTNDLDFEPYKNTIYGGTYDFTTGVLTITHIEYTNKISGYSVKNTYEGITEYQFNNITNKTILNNNTQACDIAKYSWNNQSAVYNHFYAYSATNANGTRILMYMTGTVDETREFTVVFPLETPFEMQLDPVSVTALNGTNTIYLINGTTMTAKYLA